MKRLIRSIRIDKDSYETIFFSWCICAVLIWLTAHFIHNPWISIPVSLVLVVFMFFITWFFRVPDRTVPDYENDRLVTSAADGKVVIIEKVFEKEYLQRECMQVSVYMDFFDVHCNFWPVNGKVTYYKYHPGRHILVIKPKASEENEHTCTCIRTPEGKDVFFKQIAGGFARRIVNYAQPGLKVLSGEQCGIIKFGSRLDIYLPLDARVRVRLRDVVRSAESVIAEL